LAIFDAARRRAFIFCVSLPSALRRASVISRSASPRMAMAFARVVRMRSCSNNWLISIRRKAFR
jgi:hypothetical protein